MNFDDTWLIYQHMGLGDHLICNGLIRNLVRPDRKYIMFVKPHNTAAVSYMYRDLSNVRFFQCDDAGAVDFINRFGSRDRLHLIGFNWTDTTQSFEENFYLQHGVSFSNKWESFKVERDQSLENNVYDHYGVTGDYIFVHDDSRFKINTDRLPAGVSVVRPKLGLVDTIFGYAKLIEQAKQVHCIESSFAFMVDLMKLNTEFYIHRYSRPLEGCDAVDLFGKYKNAKEILT